jgi:amino acid permease
MMIADVVGLGILTLGSAMADLGWVWGLILMTAMLFVNLYSGLLLSKVNCMYPEARDYPELGTAVLGPTFGRTVAVVNYVTMFFILGDYLLTTGSLLSMIFNSLVSVCPYVWTLVAVVLILPMHQLRSLTETTPLLTINGITITVAVFLALGYLYSTGSAPLAEEYWGEDSGGVIPGNSYAVPPDMKPANFLNGLSMLTFAYAGQFLYVDMMNEMEDPRQFPKAFAYSLPYQYIMYVLVAATSYAYLGDSAKGLIIGVLPHTVTYASPTYLAASSLLLVHMLITYLLKGIIFVQAFQRWIFPKKRLLPSTTSLELPSLSSDTEEAHASSKLEGEGKGSCCNRSQWQWFFLSLVTLFGAWLVANLIPDFDALTSLIGAMFLPLSTFLFPALMYYQASVNSDVHRAQTQEESNKILVPPLSIAHKLGLAALVLLTGVLMIFGTYSSILAVIETWNEGSRTPFGCS